MKYYKLFLSILIIVFSNYILNACPCDSPDEIKQVMRHDIVFKGKVIKVETQTSQDKNKKKYISEQEVTFEILELIKGEKSKTVKIIFFYKTTSCDLIPIDFKKNEKYLISGIKPLYVLN